MREFAKTLGRCAALLTAAALFSLNSATAEAPVRFMSLRADVLAERNGWTHMRDPDGDEVWVRSEALSERRTVYVREETTLRRTARSNGHVLAYLMPGVIGAVTACDGDWRRVAVGGRIGWVQNSSLWGGECAGLDAPVRP